MTVILPIGTRLTRNSKTRASTSASAENTEPSSEEESESISTGFNKPLPRRSQRKVSQGQPTPVNLPALPSRRKTPSAADLGRKQSKDKASDRVKAYKLKRAKLTQNDAGTSQIRPLPESDQEDQPDLPNSISTGTYQDTIQDFMADGAAPPVVQGQGPQVASFKVPYRWDRNSPSFTTDDHEDLIEFVDQVKQILELARITDEQAKKLHLTGYLPWKKRQAWRNLETYVTGTFDEFLAEVYKSYPEIIEEDVGTLDALMKICKRHRGTTILEEGKLRRFGVEFQSEVKKLVKEPAQITNKEAVRMYLGTLEPSFANALRATINSTKLLKSQLPGLVPVPIVPVVPKLERKGDLIDIGDLIKMADLMAASQDASTNPIGTKELTRDPDFSLVKIEKHDEKLEEIQEQFAEFRDTFTTSQKDSKERHAEVLKSLAQVAKGSTAAHKDIVQTGGASNTYGQDRNSMNNQGNKRDCFYCEESGHFSRECVHKEEAINKGQLVVENGKHKLGDGNFIPSGPGSQRHRVTEYWRLKALGQNYQAGGLQSFYTSDGSDPSSEVNEAAVDEIRTLRVRLARAQQLAQSNLSNIPGVLQPTFMAASQPAQQAQTAPISPVMDMGQKFAAFLNSLQGEMPVTQDQFAQTRGAAKNSGVHPPNF